MHEVWLRLVGDENPWFDSRAHFFAAAAEAMRRILIQKARRKHSLKRGAGFERFDLEHVDLAIHADDETLLLVDHALDKLAREDPQAAELVNLRFFAGMTNEEAAAVLGYSGGRPSAAGPSPAPGFTMRFAAPRASCETGL